jgi:hypothetical protein
MPRFGLKTSIACLIVGAVAGASAVIAAQPHMTNALGSLQNARAEMVRAEANKGGHRERAIGFIDQAITETREGIAFAGGR